MKKIEAIVRVSKFEDIKEALGGVGIKFFTYMEVNGYGSQKADIVTYRGAVYDSGDIPRLLLDIIVPDDKVDEVVEAILTTGATGTIGDGKIIVQSVDKFIRIRTRETGKDAL